MAVEVKDRQLAIREVQDKLPATRAQGIGELLYVVRGGLEKDEEEAMGKLVEHQFVSGHNIYVCEFENLLDITLTLFGEDGRRLLLERIGQSLDEYGELADREQWQSRLASM